MKIIEKSQYPSHQTLHVETIALTPSELGEILRDVAKEDDGLSLRFDPPNGTCVEFEGMAEIVEHLPAINIPFSIRMNAIRVEFRLRGGVDVIYERPDELRAKVIYKRLQEHRHLLAFLRPKSSIVFLAFAVLLVSLLTSYGSFNSVIGIDSISTQQKKISDILKNLAAIVLLAHSYFILFGTKYKPKMRNNLSERYGRDILLLIIGAAIQYLISRFG